MTPLAHAHLRSTPTRAAQGSRLRHDSRSFVEPNQLSSMSSSSLSSMGIPFRTTHSFSVPYVAGSAMKCPQVVPYASSENSTVTFSCFVRRLLVSLMVPTYQALYGDPNQRASLPPTSRSCGSLAGQGWTSKPVPGVWKSSGSNAYSTCKWDDPWDETVGPCKIYCKIFGADLFYSKFT